MSQPDLHEITINVDYDEDGSPTTVRYLDQEGCGHESQNIDLNQPLSFLVAYHMGHLSRSHKLEPEKYCTYRGTLTVEGEKPTEIRCSLKRHGGDVRHQLG